MRVGLCGLSHPHLPGRLAGWRAAGWEVTGGWDADPEQCRAFCRRHHVPPIEHPALLDPAVDLVVVDAWPDQACLLTADLLAAGKPVLLEKPGAPRASAFSVVAAAVRAGEQGGSRAWVQMGYHFRYSPALTSLRAWLRAGAGGRLSLVRVHGGAPAGTLPTADWLRAGERGGLLFSLGCHWVDLALWLWGAPLQVTCQLWRRSESPTARWGTEDGATAAWTYRDMLLTLEMSGWESRGYGDGWSIAVYGERGEAVAELGPCTFRRSMPLPGLAVPAEGCRRWACTQQDLFAAEAKDVRTRLRQGRAPACDAAQGAAVLDLLEALYQAAESGRAVAVAP